MDIPLCRLEPIELSVLVLVLLKIVNPVGTTEPVEVVRSVEGVDAVESVDATGAIDSVRLAEPVTVGAVDLDIV